MVAADIYVHIIQIFLELNFLIDSGERHLKRR